MPSNRTLRVAVCNLQTAIGTTRGYWHYLLTAHRYWLAHDSEQIEPAADFLRGERIDLALLCEVEGGSRRTRGVDQVDMLARRSGLSERLFFPTRIVGRRVNQGNGVVSRLPLRFGFNRALPGHGEPRFLSEAQVQLEDVSLRAFVTHLSLEHKLRRWQIDSIARALAENDEPALLGGDFNITEDAELDLIEQGHLAKAVSRKTFPAWQPTRALDHLFVSPHFEVREVYAYDREIFSDHLPLVVELSY
jgi:endonuclease/exonuclease/phosphatase family metal-dependent hydrolase